VEAVLAGRERAREGHAQHAAAALAATSELNWSAGQVYGAHAESPDAALEVPGGQARQGPPSAPVKPGLHTQKAAPAALCEFAGHAAQTPAPVSVERELKSDEEASAKLLSERW